MRFFMLHGLFDLAIIALITIVTAAPVYEQGILLATFFLIGAMRLSQYMRIRRLFESAIQMHPPTRSIMVWVGTRCVHRNLETAATTSLIRSHVPFAVLSGLMIGATAIPNHGILVAIGIALFFYGLYRINVFCVSMRDLAGYVSFYTLLAGFALFELHMSAFRVVGPLLFGGLTYAVWSGPPDDLAWPWLSVIKADTPSPVDPTSRSTSPA